MTRNFPFSWKALLFAPLVIPLVSAILFMGFSSPAREPLSIFQFLSFYLLILVVACVISYGAVIFLFLPLLFLVTRFIAPKAWLAGLTGICAGVVVYFCYLWVWYHSSGPDSGPPIGSFLNFLQLHADPLGGDFGMILGAGLVTAMLYWVFWVKGNK